MKIKEILNEGKSVTNLKLNYKDGDLLIYNSELTSLEGSPKHVTGDFDCSSNKLRNLIGGPQIVDGYYICEFNPLTSLQGVAQDIFGDFNCTACKLKSLKFAPQKIGFSIFCAGNEITSFKNVFEYIKEINGEFDCDDNPIKDGLLHILLIKGVQKIISPFEYVDEIINNYLKTNKSGTAKAMFDVQKLIIEAKLKDVPESIYME